MEYTRVKSDRSPVRPDIAITVPTWTVRRPAVEMVTTATKSDARLERRPSTVTDVPAWRLGIEQAGLDPNDVSVKFNGDQVEITLPNTKLSLTWWA